MRTNLIKHIFASAILTCGIALALADSTRAWNTDPTRLIGRKVGSITLDANDVKLLEPACVVSLSNPHVGKAWDDVIRNNPILNNSEYRILHGTESFYHYCRGKAAKIRYYKERDKATRYQLLEGMIWEFQYMVNNPIYVPDNWPYMKTMHLELGQARMLENKPALALVSFENALKLDPSYEQAHISGTDAWIALGKRDKALLQATEGLAHNPESKALKRRYLKLGGKPPFPSPRAKPDSGSKGADKAEQVPDIAKPSGVPPTSEVATDNVKRGDNAENQEAADVSADKQPPPHAPSVTEGEANETSPASQLPANPPNNPYCRFCP